MMSFMTTRSIARSFRTLALCATGAVLLTGCLERRLLITSDPPGASVSLNDVDLGRTPVEADFTFYGHYDVLVQLDGYEPIREERNISAPFYEYPPFDLAASAIPANIENNVKWHYVLSPSLEQSQTKEEFEAGLIERAKAARSTLRESPK